MSWTKLSGDDHQFNDYVNWLVKNWQLPIETKKQVAARHFQLTEVETLEAIDAVQSAKGFESMQPGTEKDMGPDTDPENKL
jgi:hypothetical protein